MLRLEGVTPNSFKLTKIVNPEDPSDVLLFDGKGFSGSSFRARDEHGNISTFDEINKFLATQLTEAERANLFKAYAAIDRYFDNSNLMRRKAGNIVDSFDSGLAKLIAKIFDIVKFKHVKDYLLAAYKEGKIRIPEDVYEDYRIDGKMQQKHIDCTYRKDDYLELVAASLYLRLMIPVWGRYLPITRIENKYNLKEYYALKLISNTPLFKEHVFTRLDTYVRGVVEVEDDISIMVAGLSTEEIPFFLMSQIVVKRLPIFSISYSADGDRNTHLMSMMYHLIGNSGKQGKIGAILKTLVFEKKPVERDWGDDASESVWDMYKSRELVSAGDLAITEVYLMDFCDGDNREMTELCYEFVKTIDLTKITPVQIKLMTWVISTLIPGNVVPLFEGKVLRRVLAIVQAKLFGWGFTELAILLTAVPVPFETDTYVSNLGQRPITNSKKIELDRIYGVDGSTDKRFENVGVKSIQDISKRFFESDWGVNCPKELYKDNEDLKLSPIFSTHGDIRNMLADLLIKLAVS